MTITCVLLSIILGLSVVINVAVGALYSDYHRRLKIAMILLRKQPGIDTEALFESLEENGAGKELPN